MCVQHYENGSDGNLQQKKSSKYDLEEIILNKGYCRLNCAKNSTFGSIESFAKKQCITFILFNVTNSGSDFHNHPMKKLRKTPIRCWISFIWINLKKFEQARDTPHLQQPLLGQLGVSDFADKVIEIPPSLWGTGIKTHLLGISFASRTSETNDLWLFWSRLCLTDLFTVRKKKLHQFSHIHNKTNFAHWVYSRKESILWEPGMKRPGPHCRTGLLETVCWFDLSQETNVGSLRYITYDFIIRFLVYIKYNLNFW